MRILTVSHFYEAHGGGIERVAGHLCRQFTQPGVQAVWAASDADQPPEAGVEAVPLACVNPTEKIIGLPIPLPGVRAIRALASEVRRSDAVVVHDALYVTSILALLMAKASRKRVVLIQHIAGIPFSSRILRSVMAMANIVVTRHMLRAADALVFISDTVRHDLVGTPARIPYQLLFNGVDGAIFHPAEGPAFVPAALAGIAISPDTRRVLFVGRYVEKKGLAVLRALAASRPDITFLTVGSGPIRPGKWGLANVHDLGAQSPQALADLYRGVDLLLLPSVGEGFPLVIQEAMACGLPVVCGEPSNRADPGAAEWLRGVAIDLTDPEGSARRCTDAIDSLAFTSVERVAMARYALAQYDWGAMARGVLTLAGAGAAEL
ncbi:glycosyltransferase family 1 protein [Mesorhizobium tamadayense]|uniref:Glycosyltransferase family 1 protein n=1 Tax=Mesorhizobium tamadayense TaxID=425306 RepID=A0A3P3FCU7_9HYPH|nr:glycosyltransferase family 4 protein [Mesorhizobium tamadayense]RRH96484.1 glycosyltransferase family 1 protein [Mesorhizobium tamadayense]